MPRVHATGSREGTPQPPPPPPRPVEKAKNPANAFVPGQRVRVSKASHESFPGHDYEIKPPALATVVGYTGPSFARLKLEVRGVLGECSADVDDVKSDSTPLHMVHDDVQIDMTVGQVTVRFPVDHRGVPGNSEAILVYSERELHRAFEDGQKLMKAAYDALQLQLGRWAGPGAR